MAGKGRPREFDRDLALGHAMDVFWEKGFEGSSMNDLIGAMGIGSPSLYAAFGSKEALFREAVKRYVTVDGADIWTAVLSAETAYQAVEGFLMVTAIAFSRPGKPKGCLVTLSGLHAGDANTAWRAEMVAMREKNTQDLTRVLARGVEQGEIAPTVNVGAIARYFVTVQQGMSIQARDGVKREVLEEIARAALAAWPSLIGMKQSFRTTQAPGRPA